MSRQFRLFRLLDALTDEGVEFVVIGGVAVTAHGSPLATFDLDICYSRAPDNLERLATALGELHARLRGSPDDLPFRPDARTLAAGDHFTFTTDAGDFDIMANPAGSDGFEGLRERAVAADLGGLTIYIASIDDLISMKTSAGRDKDLIGVAQLERIKRELETR